MKKTTYSFLLILLASLWLIVSLTGCSEDSGDVVSPDQCVLQHKGPAQDTLAENFDVFPETVTLLAGQTIEAGAIAADVLEDGSGGYLLRVTYTTVDSWELTEAHLWVGTDRAEMPQTRTGNPKIGNFPYQSGDIRGATTYSFYVPLPLSDAVCETAPDYLIAAHAALRKSNGDGTYQTETGWGDGERLVDNGSWATFFSIDITCNSSIPGSGSSGGTETAFAFGDSSAVCFSTIDADGDGANDFQRWGWTNGPLAPGIYEFDIYAGAGQCDISKGILVGTLYVKYEGSTATVTYQMGTNAAGQGYTLAETHLYLGNQIAAQDEQGRFTVAPGQYPFIHEGLDAASSDQYTINDLNGALYLIAHAVVNLP